MSPVRSLLFIYILLLVPSTRSWGDWRTEAGYSDLAAELGIALPTGAGIEAYQCEAPESGVHYLPIEMLTTPTLLGGKTYHALAGLGSASGHAAVVGSVFYQTAGISNGVDVVHSDEALNFITELDAGNLPPIFPGDVQNFSWVGSTSDSTSLLRRFDFMLNRDGKIAVVAPSNDTGPVMELMTSSHHAICAGVFSGVHNRGGTVIDGVGRMKPDLVVDQGYTSLAAPSVASAASLLLEKILASYPVADEPQVVKALLIAGASKKRLPGWLRTATSRPYDEVFGAGELNVLNAYHILVGDQQPASPSIERKHRGWDFALASSSTPQRYFFSVPEGKSANTFSASLVWHRQITRRTFISTLPNLELRLFSATGFTPGSVPIDQSVSAVDNVEHLYLRNLPAGQYMLEVSSDTNAHAYAIAWEAQIGSGPNVAVRRDEMGGIHLDLDQLDPFVTYTLEQSDTLTGWGPATTVRTADTVPATTHTWQDASAPPSGRFYRLKWTAVR